jgi:hypothetical protein
LATGNLHSSDAEKMPWQDLIEIPHAHGESLAEFRRREPAA